MARICKIFRGCLPYGKPKAQNFNIARWRVLCPSGLQNDKMVLVIKIMNENTFKQKLIDLYIDGFPEDSQNYVDYFFANKYSAENVIWKEELDCGGWKTGAGLGAYSGGNIVALLHLIYKRMNIGGRVFDCPYIVAASTNSAYRRQGHMADVMAESLRECFRRGDFISALNPFDYRFYAKYGYVAFCYGSEILLSEQRTAGRDEQSRETSFDYSVRDLGLDDFYRLYKKANEGYYGFVVRDRQECETKLAEHFSDKGQAKLFTIKKSSGQGGSKGKEIYALYNKQVIGEVSAFLYSDYDLLCNIKELDGLKVWLFADSNETMPQNTMPSEKMPTMPSDTIHQNTMSNATTPFNMARIVNAKEFLKQANYAGSVEKAVEFCVADPIIKENNLALKLTIKNGQADVVEIKNSNKKDLEVITIDELTELVFFNKILKNDYLNLSKKCSSVLAGVFKTGVNINFDKF